MEVKKIMLAVFMVAVVVGAGVAVYAILGGFDEDRDTVSPELRKTAAVGDYIEFEDGNGNTVLKYTVRSVSGTVLEVEVEKNLFISSEKMSNQEFVNKIKRYDEFKNFIKDDYRQKDKVIDTPFGNVLCAVFGATVGSTTTTVYIGADSVCYRSSVSNGAAESVTVLAATSLFGDAGSQDVPGTDVPPVPNDAVKDPVKDDYVEMDVVSGGAAYRDRFTVTEVLADGKLKVTQTRAGQSAQVIMSVQDFRSMLEPQLMGAAVSKTGDTSLPGKTCTVYTVDLPCAGSDKTVTKTMWVDASGVLQKTVLTGTGIPAGGSSVNLNQSFTLTGTSLLA